MNILYTYWQMYVLIIKKKEKSLYFAWFIYINLNLLSSIENIQHLVK